MRPILTLPLLILFFNGLAQTNQPERHPKTFKMDSITVKQYYFVMLTKGTERDKITDTAVINKLQDGHMANIKRLSKEGKMLVKQDFIKEKDYKEF